MIELLEQEIQPLKGELGQCPYCGSRYYKDLLEFRKTPFDYRFKMRCGNCNLGFYECHIGNNHWTLGI